MGEIIDVPMAGQRSLSTITAEIRTLQDAARRVVLSYSVEIGRRLTEAKTMVAHGEWGAYLKEELGFSQSTANNHMRLFEAYGAKQMTLDGAAVNSQALANLSYTQALELLALPSEEEREAFVAGHDMAAISTRELREELRKRQEEGVSEGALLSEQFDDGRAANARPYDPYRSPEPDPELLQARLKEAEDEAREVEKRFEEAMEEIKAGNIERDRLADQAKAAAAKQAAAEAQALAAAEKMGALDKQLREARKAEKDARAALKEAKENPTVPTETLEKLRREAEAAAAKAHEAAQGELEQAKAKWLEAEENASKIRAAAETAKAEAKAAAEKLAATEKALRLAAPEMAEFRFRVQVAQEALTACVTALDALPEDKQAGGVRILRRLLEAYGGQLPDTEEA